MLDKAKRLKHFSKSLSTLIQTQNGVTLRKKAGIWTRWSVRKVVEVHTFTNLKRNVVESVATPRVNVTLHLKISIETKTEKGDSQD